MPKMDGIETMKQGRRLAGNQNPMAPTNRFDGKCNGRLPETIYRRGL